MTTTYRAVCGNRISMVEFYADERNWINDVVDIGVGNQSIPDSSLAAQDHGQVARDALSTAPQAPVKDDWLPIETAPKDGTKFIAACEVNTTKGPSFWDRHIVAVDEDTGEIAPDCDQGWGIDDYTHWMPLPAPPSEVKP